VLEWLRGHDPGRLYLKTTDASITYGEMVTAVEGRQVSGTEVLRPWPYRSSVVDLLAVMSKGSAIIAAEDGPELVTIDAAGAASVIFTSGTSGGSRAARLTRANWEAAARASVEHLGHGSEDLWLLAMPLHHVGGLSILLRSAFIGGGVKMLPGFEPAAFARELHDEVTMASVVPTMLSRVLDADPGPYDGLRAVLVGGGPIPDDLLERAGEARLPVLPTYGMTETCGQVATLRPGSRLENRAHPLPGVEIRIETDGRIAVRGPMVSPGYVGETDRAPDQWFVTGDLGEIDADGALRVIGRADTLIISGGENIDPTMVETALARVPGVESAMVVGVPSEQWGTEVVCLYVGDAGSIRIQSHLRDRLPSFMIPKRFVRVQTLPMTAMGKLDRAEAMRMVSEAGAR